MSFTLKWNLIDVAYIEMYFNTEPGQREGESKVLALLIFDTI